MLLTLMNLFHRQVYDQEVVNRKVVLCNGSSETTQQNDSDAEFDGGFKVPGQMWNKLYR